MKRLVLFKKRDAILFLGILLLGIVLLLCLHYFQKEGNNVIVEQNGKVIMNISLNDSGTYFIKDEDSWNELIIEDGKAFMNNANCKDLICVHQGSISKVNESITCLPHKLIVYVTGEDMSDIDAVVN